jgi:hypothetical protein
LIPPPRRRSDRINHSPRQCGRVRFRFHNLSFCESVVTTGSRLMKVLSDLALGAPRACAQSIASTPWDLKISRMRPA